jgi:hypothetical protein
MMMMMMMRRPSSLRVRAEPRHLPYIYIYIIFLFFIIGPRIIWDVINRHPHMIRVAWSTLLAFQLLRIKITAEKEIQDFQLLD